MQQARLFLSCVVWICLITHYSLLHNQHFANVPAADTTMTFIPNTHAEKSSLDLFLLYVQSVCWNSTHCGYCATKKQITHSHNNIQNRLLLFNPHPTPNDGYVLVYCCSKYIKTQNYTYCIDTRLEIIFAWVNFVIFHNMITVYYRLKVNREWS